MVSQTDANQLQMDEFERWAGGLSPNINDVMAENLSRMLGTDRVVTLHGRGRCLFSTRWCWISGVLM